MFLIHIKLYLPEFQFKMKKKTQTTQQNKPQNTVSLCGNCALTKQLHLFGVKPWRVDARQLSNTRGKQLLVREEFKAQSQPQSEKSLNHAAIFPAMATSGVKCLIYKKNDSSCSGQSLCLRITLSSAVVCGRLHRHRGSLVTQRHHRCLAAETKVGKRKE